MKLTYRGVRYIEKEPNFAISAPAVKSKEIIYRGNSPKARISPKFPWRNYVRQLFSKSGAIFDPIAFWYDHKRDLIKDCWFLDDVVKLDRAWDLTLQIERTEALKRHNGATPISSTQLYPHQVKLKYRGVTYYR